MAPDTRDILLTWLAAALYENDSNPPVITDYLHLLAEHFISLLFLVSVGFGVFIILDLVLSVDILAIGLP